MTETTSPSTGHAWAGDTADLLEVLARAGDAITVQGVDGSALYANQAAADLTGFATAQELVDASAEELAARFELFDEAGEPISFDDQPGRRLVLGEASVPPTVIGFRTAGTTGMRWALLQATPIRRDGRISHVINIFHDVTHMRRHEEQLRILADASAALANATDFESALTEMADRVVPSVADWCVIDVVDGEGLRRVAVAHPDPEMRALAEELERRYPPDPDAGGVADVLRTGETVIVPEVTEEMLREAARDENHLRALVRLGLGSVAVVPFVVRRQPLGALTLARSRTREPFTADDRAFLDELAGRAAGAVDASRLLVEANEAIRLRDDFLAMASHDMRTPLSTILGNIQLARRRLENEELGAPGESRASERLSGLLESAERTTRKLTRLVEELMDISMLSTGHPLPIEAVELDIVELVRELVAEQQRLANRHDLRVTGVDQLIGRWDALRVERVLDNLLDNAVKYSPGGGTITVRVESLPAGGASIAVTDEGIGIPPADIDGIFRPYQRGSNATELRGIGLGLAGSRDVVRQLDGEIAVVSQEGRGSTFTLHLPELG